MFSGFLKHAPNLIRLTVLILTLGFVAQSVEVIASLEFSLSRWREHVDAIGLFWLSLLAPSFYIFAVWAAAEVLDRINAGDTFGPVMVKGLREVGSNLLWGAVAAVIIQPTLSVWIEERFRGIRFDGDIASVTIGILGGVLWLVATQGEKLKTEVDSFI